MHCFSAYIKSCQVACMLLIPQPTQPCAHQTCTGGTYPCGGCPTLEPYHASVSLVLSWTAQPLISCISTAGMQRGQVTLSYKRVC